MSIDRELGARPPAPALQPIADIQLDPARHLVDSDDGPSLLGSRCDACGNQSFPRREVCLACGGRELRAVALPGCGTLYTYSTVHVSASRKTPYTIGYVDLDGGVRVLAEIRATTATPRIDGPVRLRREAQAWFFEPLQDPND